MSKKQKFSETTTAGSVAAVAMPLGGVKKRKKTHNPDGTIKNALDSKQHLVNSSNKYRKQEKKMKKKTSEGLANMAHKVEKDHEVQMARADLYKVAKYAIKLHEMLRQISEEEGLEGWQQAKITKASDYISAVYHSLDYEKNVENNIQMSTMAMEQTAKKSTDLYKRRLHNRISERMLTKGEEKKREKNVKGMKKNTADFKKRYGKDAETVMYATATKKAKKESLNRQAKKLLGEGKEYKIYLRLSEAPMTDVVNKLKKGLSKLPKQTAAKTTSLIKKIPKSAWPIAAGIVLSMAGTDPAAAGDLVTNIDTDAVQDGLSKLQQMSQQFSKDVASLGKGSADAAQSAVEVSMDQIKQANRMLGGGDINTIRELIQNGVDLERVKSLLDKKGVTDSLDIGMALMQIEGDNIVPMIQWVQRMH